MLEARQVGPGLVRGAGARSVKIKSSSIRGIRDTDESRLMVRRFRIKLKSGYRYLLINIDFFCVTCLKYIFRYQNDLKLLHFKIC